jgi:Fic family protein
MVNIKDRVGIFEKRTTANESFRTYTPKPLPLKPPLILNLKILDLLEKANQALGRLDMLGDVLPDTDLFIYLYVRKEALLSSQIEGTQSSLSDLLLYEAEARKSPASADLKDVVNYIAAMDHGLDSLRKGTPICSRLLREIHTTLLSSGRGSLKQPGEFRTSQNWVGGTRPGNALFVPCPPEAVIPCMTDLEKFVHDQTERTPTLIKAALAHHQFETIHPFLDGNGRLGRLLITLILSSEKAMSNPILYLSLYFKMHREEYYGLLQSVREQGTWEQWLEFFLQGVIDTGSQATSSAKELMRLIRKDTEKVHDFKRSTPNTIRAFQLLQKNPFINIGALAKSLDVSIPTATQAVEILEKLKILREYTGKQRGKSYAYHRYWEIIEAGTEPIPGG